MSIGLSILISFIITGVIVAFAIYVSSNDHNDPHDFFDCKNDE
jgi:hypothetical protein